MLLAGVDPVQENKLVGLDTTIVQGSPLSAEDTYRQGDFGSQIPAIVSNRTFSDAHLTVAVNRLEAPSGDVPTLLNQPTTAPAGGNAVYQNLVQLPESPLRSIGYGPDDLYGTALSSFVGGGAYLTGYWSAGQVSFSRQAGGALQPQALPPDWSVWADGQSNGGYLNLPPTNADTQYRPITYHRVVDANGVLNSGLGQIQVQGQFDPARLPGFSELSAVPLEAYSPPIATAADPATATTLGGEPYRSSLNVGGYLTEPPFVLTTIAGVHGLTDPRFYTGGNNEAPLSVIRVRVAGVTGVDPTSLGRITTVAGLIAQRTGLDVDITAGSSPQPQQIQLAASPLGTPALVLDENWIAKGVAIQIITAIDRKSLLLLVLILVVSVVFLANAGFATIRTRRPEFATLACLGWRRRTIFAAVFAELAAVGTAAGVLGTALAFGISAWFGLEQTTWRLLLVAPISLLLAVAAGLVPAVSASRGAPLEAVTARNMGGKGAVVRGVTSLALCNLRRSRGRTALAALALWIGVGALAALTTFILAFQGVVTGTLLGNFVSVQVQAVDYVIVALVLLLAVAAVADVLVLSMRERAVELVTLRITGWSDPQLTRLVLTEGIGIGLIGSILGATTAAFLGLAVGGSPQATLLACALAAIIGLAITALASIIPALGVTRLPIGVASAEA